MSPQKEDDLRNNFSYYNLYFSFRTCKLQISHAKLYLMEGKSVNYLDKITLALTLEGKKLN